MAELGLVASIIGLAGSGAKLALSLYSIADSIGSAGREARIIAAEVSLFSQSLTALSKSLKRRTSQTSKLCETAQVLMVSCHSILEELSELVGELAPASCRVRRRNKMSELIARMKWLFRRPKMAFLRSSIESFKCTLTLLVSSMDLTEADEYSAPEEIKLPLRTQVQTLIETAKDAHNNAEQAHNLVRAQIDGKLPAAEIVAQTSETPLIDFGIEKSANGCSVLPEEPDSAVPWSGDGMEVQTSAFFADAAYLDLVTHRIDLRSQQLVVALARDALQHARPGAASSANRRGTTDRDATSDRFATPPTVSLPTLDPAANAQSHVEDFDWNAEEIGGSGESSSPLLGRRTEDSNNDRIKKLETFMKSLENTNVAGPLRTPHLALKGADGERLRRLEDLMLGFERAVPAAHASTQEEPGSSRLSQPENDFAALQRDATVRDRILQGRDTREQSMGSRGPSSVVEGHTALKGVGGIDDMRASIRDMVKQELAGTTTSEVKAPISFKDAVGRKFGFPWHLAKTWKGMEPLIKHAFLHVDVIGEHVHQGHYDLSGPDGKIILPQVWDSVVQPGWAVAMHMWPMQDPDEAMTALTLTDPFAGMQLPICGLPKNVGQKKSRKRRKNASVSPWAIWLSG
ncbi:hypothetical protein LTR85_007045 [Meristemomyces frigidus]|nr:hypothetical protein LTR85_007045 [Meristemomyces frigidus]